MENFEIIDYSEKSIAVVGDRGDMKEIGIFLGVCLLIIGGCLADSVTILPTLISVAVGGSLIVISNNKEDNMNEKNQTK